MGGRVREGQVRLNGKVKVRVLDDDVMEWAMANARRAVRVVYKLTDVAPHDYILLGKLGWARVRLP